jgi:predicted ferric reductase/Ca2+-binding EF-hand superfamily protein
VDVAELDPMTKRYASPSPGTNPAVRTASGVVPKPVPIETSGAYAISAPSHDESTFDDAIPPTVDGAPSSHAPRTLASVPDPGIHGRRTPARDGTVTAVLETVGAPGGDPAIDSLDGSVTAVLESVPVPPRLPDGGGTDPFQVMPSLQRTYSGLTGDSGASAPASIAGPPPSSRCPQSVDQALLTAVHDSFDEYAGPEGVIDSEGLRRAIDIRDRKLADRVHAAFDRDGDGRVTREEFLGGVQRLVFGTPRDKLRFAFRINDLDGSGYIERHELRQMIALCLAEERSEVDPDTVERLAGTLMKAADSSGSGRINFAEFEAVVEAHPEVMELITRTEARWIAPDEDLLARLAAPPKFNRRIGRLLDNRLAFVVVVVLWCLANVGMFALAVLKYQALGASHWVMLARGCGACLNLNGALILVPVMRRLVTWIRNTPGLRLLPADDAIAFHRLVGEAMFVFGLVHTAAHVVNYQLATPGILSSLLYTSAGLTGLLLFVVFAVMWTFARPRIRRSGRFELFYFTHLLYVAWFVLALLHGPVFWLWATLPLVGFGLEKVLGGWRAVRRTEVLDAEPLRSGVTRLTIRRPPGFQHRAGDYLFLRVPALARYEWHPFTISSAPEREHLTLHVRSLGNFTAALRRLAQARQALGETTPFSVCIDGPHGTASGHIFGAKHAVVIGAGIGVTPFASVLESIVYRAQHGTTVLEKVHFFWLNRDARSFEWFAALLSHIEQVDRQGLVELHIHMTDGRGHISSTALNLARDVWHALGEPDHVTGLRSKTRMGPPDWRRELREIAARHAPEPVDVFFCGPPGLGRVVRAACRHVGLRFRQEHF